MKNYLIVLGLVLVSLTSFAQEKDDKKLEKAEIKTSAVCDMCKTTLEKAMAYEKGVKKSDLDVKTKVLTVWYRPDKTSVEAIRKAVSKTGYDADTIPADAAAYERLNPCCKKDAHQ